MIAVNIVALIPARMGSSRFPGKPLAPILGVPMVGHIYHRTAMSPALSATWIATCDQEIADYAESIGARVVMTADTHQRCSDRCAEAMETLERESGERIDMVVMVQGDEPLVTPDMIDIAVRSLRDNPDAGVSCLMGDIEHETDFADPNEVKVVTDRRQRALYFSREPIPTRSRDGGAPWHKQVCIIPYRRDYLLRFNALEPTPLEIAESVDLNRCLEHGDPVQMAHTSGRMVSVDTPQDLERAVAALREDSLVARYRHG